MEQQMMSAEKGATPSKTKRIFYWIFTALVAFELLLGATWDFNWVNQSFVRNVMSHLGYPPYMDTLLGLAKIPAAIILLIPGFLILKEWAYAGTVFIFAGAVFSHIAMGDGWAGALFPAIYTLLTLASWALRPAKRKLTPEKSIVVLRWF